MFGGFPVSTFSLNDPLAGWHGRVSVETVATDSVDQIRAGLAEAGFFAAPPIGAFLDSGDFYWVVNACVEGRYRFNAFAAPAQAVAAFRFFTELLRHDRTAIAVKPVRSRHPRGQASPGTPTSLSAAELGPRFLLQVGENGLLVRPLG